MQGSFHVFTARRPGMQPVASARLRVHDDLVVRVSDRSVFRGSASHAKLRRRTLWLALSNLSRDPSMDCDRAPLNRRHLWANAMYY
jgi:hypothetical protein